MKIVIAGGCGFLGSHLCENLVNGDNEIICLDNLYTGRLQNVKNLFSLPNFKFINHDITEYIDIKADYIYNLACPASPIHYQYDPIKTAKTSVLGSLNLLELAKKYNARILQASTSEIYGNPLIHPQPESYWGNVNTIGIRSCYDEGKRMAETLFFDYNRYYGVDIRVVRIFNTYGPRMDIGDGRVISNFIIQALKNKDITVYGQGTQTRSFCFVDDLIAGMIKMMNNNSGFIGPVNLGNPEEFTILDTAKKIIELTGSKSKIIFEPLPSDDPVKRKPLITLAKEKLNWQPSVDFETGLIKTIEYFKNIV